MVRKKLRAFALKKIAMITEDSIRKSSLTGCSHPLKGRLNRHFICARILLKLACVMPK